jgi:hypothetical protein
VDQGGTLTPPAPGVLGNDVDACGDPLTAALVDDPAHGTVTLNPDGSFVYVHDGSDTVSDIFTYVANDGEADSNVATVTITINLTCHPPEADAGPDQEATLCDTVSLDGTGSHDPDTPPELLGYEWHFAAVPPGSERVDGDIVGQGTPNAQFVPDVTGVYVVQLEVSDDCGNDTDNVVILVRPCTCFHDATPLVSISSVNERATLDRPTRTVVRTADIVVTNVSLLPIDLPIQAAFVISDTQVDMPEASGVNADGNFYYDLGSVLGITELAPGQTVVFGIRMTSPMTVRFTYAVQLWGTSPCNEY